MPHGGYEHGAGYNRGRQSQTGNVLVARILLWALSAFFGALAFILLEYSFKRAGRSVTGLNPVITGLGLLCGGFAILPLTPIALWPGTPLLVAFVAFALGGSVLGFTFRCLGPVWLIPLAFLVAVSGGTAALIGVIPWLSWVAPM